MHPLSDPSKPAVHDYVMQFMNKLACAYHYPGRPGEVDSPVITDELRLFPAVLRTPGVL
jgi:hypothetical protein